MADKPDSDRTSVVPQPGQVSSEQAQSPSVSFREFIGKINEHIEDRQSDIKPQRTEKILVKVNNQAKLTPNEKVHLVTLGKSVLQPEERLTLTNKKKGVAQYGMISTVVAFASGIMGGMLSRKFIKAKPYIQLGVFAVIFSGSTYFQMYPIIDDYVFFHVNMYDKYRPSLIEHAVKQQAIAKLRAEQKEKTKK
jgi:hypothetical protein